MCSLTHPSSNASLGFGDVFFFQDFGVHRNKLVEVFVLTFEVQNLKSVQNAICTMIQLYGGQLDEVRFTMMC